MGGYLIIFGIIILDILAIADVIRSNVKYCWVYILLIVVLPFFGFSIWYLYKAIFSIKHYKIKAKQSHSFLSSDLKGNRSNSNSLIQDHELICLNESLVCCNRIFRESNDFEKLKDKQYVFSPSESDSIINDLALQYDNIINALALFLSNRECLVCILTSLDISEDSISSLLFVSNTTVRAYKSKIKSKLPSSYYEMFISSKLSALKRNTYSSSRHHNSTIHNIISLFVLTTTLYSCQDRGNNLSLVLKTAGDNRLELETVLNHYRKEDCNPLKLRAAEYLIRNLPAHYSYLDEDVYSYYDYAALILSDTMLTPEQQRDSLLTITDCKYSDLPSNIVPDAQIIKADFLIDNIDKSFNQWDTCPWAKQLTFDEYLEWLLPYKAVELQELDHWRDTLLAYFGTGLAHPIKNDVEYNTTLGVADMIRNDVNSRLHRYGLYTRAGLPLLSAYLQVHQTFGNIQDYALTAVLAFRSAGIPAVLDETPVGSRYTAASKWFVILSDKGDELSSEWDVSTQIGWGFFPYERGPKVYRNTYMINEERREYKKHAKFQYPFDLGKKDITSKYFLTSDLSIPIDNTVKKCLKDKYVYIASAVRSEEHPWEIVDFGVLKHGKARFHNMGREVLYQLQGYDGEGLIPISRPFILHKDCSIEYVDSDTLNSMYLNKWKNNAL